MWIDLTVLLCIGEVCPFQTILTCLSLAPHTCVTDPGHHWFSNGLSSVCRQNHYRSQWLLLINHTSRNINLLLILIFCSLQTQCSIYKSMKNLETNFVVEIALNVIGESKMMSYNTSWRHKNRRYLHITTTTACDPWCRLSYCNAIAVLLHFWPNQDIIWISSWMKNKTFSVL